MDMRKNKAEEKKLLCCVNISEDGRERRESCKTMRPGWLSGRTLAGSQGILWGQGCLTHWKVQSYTICL